MHIAIEVTVLVDVDTTDTDLVDMEPDFQKIIDTAKFNDDGVYDVVMNSYDLAADN